MRVAGILVVAGLERERGVHQIQVDGVEPKSVQAGLQCRLDPFGAMVVVPQLGGHKQLVAADCAVVEQLFKCGADLGFVAIPFGGVEVPEPDLDRGFDSVARLSAIGQRRSEPERRESRRYRCSRRT